MKPVEVDSLLLSPGERYDVLLKATANKSTWIRAVTLDGNEVKAVLLYTDGTPGELPTGPVVWGKRESQSDQMKSPASVDLREQPQEIKLTLGGTMSPYVWNINGQEFPKADPIKLAANQAVRFVLENPTMMDHPFHLHGHYFHVLGNPDKLNLTDPVQKDSINIPAKSTWCCNGSPPTPASGFSTATSSGIWQPAWPGLSKLPNRGVRGLHSSSGDVRPTVACRDWPAASLRSHPVAVACRVFAAAIFAMRSGSRAWHTPVSAPA